MQYLRTNTATRITVGPFLDKTDGITPETALTVTNEKLTFIVDDGGVPTLVLDAAPTASGGNNDMVHITGDDAGYYDLELTAANVNYLGRAKLALTDAANHCPVFQEFMIIPAMVYDSLILGTDLLDSSVVQWTGTNVASPDTAGYPKVTMKTGTGAGEVSLNSGTVTLTDASLTAAKFGAGAIDSNAIATDAIGSAEISAAAVSKIQSGLSVLDAAAVRTAIGLASANLDTQLAAIAGYIDTEIASIISSIAALNNLSTTQVKAQIVAALNTDTYAEPSSVPAATATLVAKIGFLMALARNKITQTGSTQTLYADDGSTTVATAAVSDDGTTATRGEFA